MGAPTPVKVGSIILAAFGVTIGLAINIIGSLVCLHVWPIVAVVALCFAPIPNLVFGFSKIEPNIFGMEQMSTFAFLGNFISGMLIVSGYAFPFFARHFEYFIFGEKPYGWDLNDMNPVNNLFGYGILDVNYLFWISTILGYIGATLCYVSIVGFILIWTKCGRSDDDDDLF